MNQYVTSTVIKKLREQNHLTQAKLADKLSVSDKTIPHEMTKHQKERKAREMMQNPE